MSIASPVPIRVLFLWTTFSGYMSSCRRELAKRPKVDLLVIAYRSSAKSNTAHYDSLLASNLFNAVKSYFKEA